MAWCSTLAFAACGDDSSSNDGDESSTGTGEESADDDDSTVSITVTTTASTTDPDSSTTEPADSSTTEPADSSTTEPDESSTTDPTQGTSTDETTDGTTTDATTEGTTTGATTEGTTTGATTDGGTTTDGGAVCGDGVQEDPEACDTDDLAGQDCTTLNFASGTLACTVDCTFDTSACVAAAVCGDGVQEQAEDCDGADLGTEDCISLGFDGGVVACANDCTYDTTGCTQNDCIDEDLGGEDPDGVVGNNTGGTDDLQGSCVTGVGGLDFIYEWTAPADGTYIIDTSNATTTIDTVVYVLDSCGGNQLACNDDGGAGATSIVNVTLTAGQTILIVVDGYNAAAVGPFELQIASAFSGDAGSCCFPGPVTTPGCDVDPVEACVCQFDSFCCATDWDSTCVAEAINVCAATCEPDACLTEDLGSELGDNLASGTNVGAGNETNVSCDGTSAEDVAFSWTAPADGTYVFDTSGSDYDTALALLGPDCSLGATLACNDQANGTNQSEVSRTMVAGETVYVVIEGFNGASGNYQLDINEFVPDLSCAADDLGMALGAAVATGNTALEANDYTTTCGLGGSADVIYTWTAPAAGSYTFSLAGSDYDTVLALSNACNLPNLACNDDFAGITPDSQITTMLTAGQQIIIVVAGYNGMTPATGNYTLAITAN